MARIYIHIGTHKTGTSSIQYYLNCRKDDLQAQQILFPEAGKASNIKSSGNHRLAWAVDLQKGETTTESWDQLAKIMNSVVHEITVISSEAFCKLSIDKVRQVKELLKGHEVFIIVYFRNYKTYIRAIYSQVIKDHTETRSFPRYIKSTGDWMNYDRILRNWGENFGYDHLVIRVYDEVIFKDNILKDFCRIIGFKTLENDPDLKLQRNISPDEKTIRILRMINICKKTFPFLIKDQTLRRLKRAVYNNTKEYMWQKRLLKLIARNQFYSDHAENLIINLTKNANQGLLHKMIEQESMDFLQK